MSKEEIRSALRQTCEQLAALEANHIGQEMRPWSCGDHPIAVQHWKLVQRRIKLKKQLGRPTRSADHVAAMARGRRRNGTVPSISPYQIDEKPLGELRLS
jgi:hypothetical protein